MSELMPWKLSFHISEMDGINLAAPEAVVKAQYTHRSEWLTPVQGVPVYVALHTYHLIGPQTTH